MEWIDNVLRDVAELPDRNSPEDWPEAMLVTGDELRQIIVTHAPAEPVNARLLAALKRLSFCAQTTGGVAGRDDELCSAIEASAKAIAAAEAQQERLLQDMHDAGREIDRVMAEPQPDADGWINPNDKTRKQYLPHIGERVLFCHAGITYYGKHTGGSFQSFNPPRTFGTWDCLWMYPPKAREAQP